MFTSKIKISTRVQNLLFKRTTKWGNLCIICLFGDFNVYGSSLCSNICLLHTITPTDILAQINDKLPLEEKKYGYDDSRFEKDVDEHFHCSICYNVLKLRQ